MMPCSMVGTLLYICNAEDRAEDDATCVSLMICACSLCSWSLSPSNPFNMKTFEVFAITRRTADLCIALKFVGIRRQYGVFAPTCASFRFGAAFKKKRCRDMFVCSAFIWCPGRVTSSQSEPFLHFGLHPHSLECRLKLQRRRHTSLRYVSGY